MTGRRLLLVAAAAVAVVAVGLLTRPLLPRPPHRMPASVSGSARPVPPALIRLAAVAAAADLRCPLRPRRPGACGRLTVGAAGGYRIGTSTALVRLVGDLATSTGGTVPVAMAVTLTNTGSGWSATVVAP